MKDKELFIACTTQCIWCLEQWPIKATGGHMLHVGPFTQDKHLFSTVCKAESIRQAFEYITYKGGKQIVRKPRTAKQLYFILTKGEKRNGGICKRVMSPDNRSFWRTGCRATLEVAGWPEWMQSYGIDGKKSEPVSQERLKATREEILFYDECDFACRQQCTENLQYRPKLERNWTEPTCNDGMGCMTCWERFEKAKEEWENAHPCLY
jgi:hypothetical protein